MFEISGRGEFGLKQRWGEKEMGIGMKGLGMGFGVSTGWRWRCVQSFVESKADEVEGFRFV